MILLSCYRVIGIVVVENGGVICQKLLLCKGFPIWLCALSTRFASLAAPLGWACDIANAWWVFLVYIDHFCTFFSIKSHNHALIGEASSTCVRRRLFTKYVSTAWTSCSTEILLRLWVHKEACPVLTVLSTTVRTRQLLTGSDCFLLVSVLAGQSPTSCLGHAE